MQCDRKLKIVKNDFEELVKFEKDGTVEMDLVSYQVSDWLDWPYTICCNTQIN